jgi:hypothetical protein
MQRHFAEMAETNSVCEKEERMIGAEQSEPPLSMIGSVIYRGV